ncbi:phosphatase PAP2 family protein [Vibrio palustris]|uniref:undecaprenyl-diphosphate phosphatase n=1 Tax=Vibrio palustris TaxID=1918946 RepID=A0A1R4B642_9VIBR|nr:phosphatase PAP2 family protein [Vibrio palustris]SJL84390.1 Phosphatidylglycerophosphatase B [Vibrio palustris]
MKFVHWRESRDKLVYLLLCVITVMTTIACFFFWPVNLLGHPNPVMGFTMHYLSYSAQGWVAVCMVGAWLLWSLKGASYSLQRCLSLFAQLFILLLIANILKLGIKDFTEVSRPYTTIMTQHLLLPEPTHFYKLGVEQKLDVMSNMKNYISHWRLDAWKQHLDYAFPSGHTIFVAICALFFGSLFIEQKRYVSLSVLLVWTLGVAYSRLWLGVHRPMDLIGAFALVGGLYWFVPRHYAITQIKTIAKIKRFPLNNRERS